MATTMNDVAREAKVSRALVSLVFRDSPKVSPASRKRVLAAAEKLGYRPNAVARSLASRSSRTFGVLLNDITNPFFAEVFETIALSCEAAGYEILMGAGQRSMARESAIIGNFLSHRVDGLLLISPRIAAKSLAGLIDGTPTVLVGKSVSLPGVDCVLNDEHVGARLQHRLRLDGDITVDTDRGADAQTALCIERRGVDRAAQDALTGQHSLELTVGELTQRGYYLGSNVSYNLKKLIEQGYIAQARSPHDRRSVRIKLTQKGLDLHRRLDGVFQKHADELARGTMKLEELTATDQTLRRIERFWNTTVAEGGIPTTTAA